MDRLTFVLPSTSWRASDPRQALSGDFHVMEWADSSTMKLDLRHDPLLFAVLVGVDHGGGADELRRDLLRLLHAREVVRQVRRVPDERERVDDVVRHGRGGGVVGHGAVLRSDEGWKQGCR